MSLMLPPNYLGRSLGARSGAVVQTTKTVSDVTSSSGSASDITGLYLTVPPGVAYSFRFVVPYSSAGTGVGIRLGLSYDDTVPVLCSMVVNVPTGASSTAGLFTAMIVSDGASVGPSSVSVANSTYIAWCEGVIYNGATAITLQAIFNGSSAGTNVTVKAPALGWAMEI